MNNRNYSRRRASGKCFNILVFVPSDKTYDRNIMMGHFIIFGGSFSTSMAHGVMSDLFRRRHYGRPTRPTVTVIRKVGTGGVRSGTRQCGRKVTGLTEWDVIRKLTNFFGGSQNYWDQEKPGTRGSVALVIGKSSFIVTVFPVTSVQSYYIHRRIAVRLRGSQ